MNKYEIKKRIEELREEIKFFELDPDDYAQEFDDYFNEIYEPIYFGELSYDPAQVLKAVDPIAYRQALLEYVDSIELNTVDEYRELLDELQDLEEQLEEE